MGAVVGLASLDYLRALISDMHIGDTGYGWIIDRQKRTVAHPATEYLGNTDILSGGAGTRGWPRSPNVWPMESRE